MKKRIFVTMLICFMIVMVFSLSTSAAVLTINEIRSNQQSQSAELGFELGDSLVLTTGANVLFLSLSFEQNNEIGGNNDLHNISVRGNLISPNLGMKYYLNDNKTRPYLRGNLFRLYSNISVTVENDDENEELIDEDIEEVIEDAFGVTGGKLGFGVEYKINENFGLSGETGTRFVFNSIEHEYDNINSEVSAFFGATYSNLGINFYF